MENTGKVEFEFMGPGEEVTARKFSLKQLNITRDIWATAYNLELGVTSSKNNSKHLLNTNCLSGSVLSFLHVHSINLLHLSNNTFK